MKKIRLGTALFLSLGLLHAAFSISALPLNDLLTNAPASPLSFQKKTIMSGYADFSGKWEGTCVNSEGSAPISFKIATDDRSLQIDNYVFFSGSLSTQSSADEESTRVLHAKYHWTEKNSFVMNLMMLENRLSSRGVSQLASSLSKLSFVLEENKLIIRGSVYLSMEYTPNENSTSSSFECIMAKTEGIAAPKH